MADLSKIILVWYRVSRTGVFDKCVGNGPLHMEVAYISISLRKPGTMRISESCKFYDTRKLADGKWQNTFGILCHVDQRVK
jgi:hypothetical protein